LAARHLKTQGCPSFEASNLGGHSSRPRPDNAIYSLAAALVRIGQYEFPVKFTDTTRAYFTETAKLSGGEEGAAMMRLIANPNDLEANAIVSRNPTYHSMLRTTCVATTLDGGHANNALAQRAGANINCRMLPGDPIDNVLAQLIKAAADPSLIIAPAGEISPTPAPPPLTRWSMAPRRHLQKNTFRGYRCCQRCRRAPPMAASSTLQEFPPMASRVGSPIPTATAFTALTNASRSRGFTKSAIIFSN
jgi:acetylornithine deacetylase/succinyl-diaminopimelate desuccinylase-like protein